MIFLLFWFFYCIFLALLSSVFLMDIRVYWLERMCVCVWMCVCVSVYRYSTRIHLNKLKIQKKTQITDVVLRVFGHNFFLSSQLTVCFIIVSFWRSLLNPPPYILLLPQVYKEPILKQANPFKVYLFNFFILKQKIVITMKERKKNKRNAKKE